MPCVISYAGLLFLFHQIFQKVLDVIHQKNKFISLKLRMVPYEKLIAKWI